MGPLFWMPNIVYTNILLWSDANAIMPVMKKRTNDASDKDNIPSSTWTTTKNTLFQIQPNKEFTEDVHYRYKDN